MIIVSPAGGICNRITALEAAYHLSKRLNQKCIVLWNLKDELNCEFHTLFQNIEGVKVITIKNADLIEPFFVIVRKLFSKNLFFYDFNNNYFDRNCKKYIDGTFDEQKNPDFERMFKSNKIVFLKEPYYSFYGKLTYDIVKAQPYIHAKVDEIISEYFSYIGVHIRGTDHIACKQNVKIELYIERIENEIEKNPDTLIYLATDEECVRERFIKEFGNRVVYNKDAMLNRTSNIGVISGLVDLLCLSKTNIIYGSFASTFSIYAASINNTPLKVCVDGRWGNYHSNTLDDIKYIAKEYINFEEDIYNG